MTGRSVRGATLMVAALLLAASPGHALSTLGSFPSSILQPNTRPQLALTVQGGSTNTGGVSLSSGTSFDLDIEIEGSVASVDNLILTAATNSSALTVSITCASSVCGGSPPSTTATLAPGAFQTTAAFGIDLSELNGLGNGNGAGDYFKLVGSLMGGFDLMTGLVRGGVVTVSVEVAGFDYAAGDRLRFDVFGTDASGTVVANNPISGSAGVTPEPGAMLVFGIGLFTVSRFVRRRR
jgi:hypothetical protein